MQSIRLLDNAVIAAIDYQSRLPMYAYCLWHTVCKGSCLWSQFYASNHLTSVIFHRNLYTGTYGMRQLAWIFPCVVQTEQTIDYSWLSPWWSLPKDKEFVLSANKTTISPFNERTTKLINQVNSPSPFTVLAEQISLDLVRWSCRPAQFHISNWNPIQQEDSLSLSADTTAI